MTYRKLLGDLRQGRYTFEDFRDDRGIGEIGDISPEFKSLLEAEGLYENIAPDDLLAQVFEKFRQLPPVSDLIIIRYLHQGSGDHIGDKVVLYDPETIGQKLVHALQFWNGERPATGVDYRERWKCNYCEYKGVHCRP
jgi:exonuclease V